MDFDAFSADGRTQDAVERRFLIIGEALIHLNRTSPELAGRIPELRKAIGLRNQLAHVCHWMEPADILDAAVNDLPKFLRTVQALLAELDASATIRSAGDDASAGTFDIPDPFMPSSPFD
ncbi:MAG: DUF86 domain-containing protein [Albidovulum sp.]|nr:DUF86 domain-containing protein [Albidovulum sp.]